MGDGSGLQHTLTKKGDRVGDRLVNTITPRAADKLSDKFIERENGERVRIGAKLVVLCRKAWRMVRRLFPDEFKDVPNPWVGVIMKTRVKTKKPAETRSIPLRMAASSTVRSRRRRSP
jgi:hypothetical protein